MSLGSIVESLNRAVAESRAESARLALFDETPRCISCERVLIDNALDIYEGRCEDYGCAPAVECDQCAQRCADPKCDMDALVMRTAPGERQKLCMCIPHALDNDEAESWEPIQ